MRNHRRNGAFSLIWMRRNARVAIVGAAASAAAMSSAVLVAGSTARADEAPTAVRNASVVTTTTHDTSMSEAHPWCAPELGTLSNNVCTYTPEKIAEGPKTLVVFLHGVTSPDSDGQYAFQRAGARIADARGFTVIMPRGRRGVGPAGMEDAWTWPTSQTGQHGVEDELLGEWATAQGELESKNGVHFDRVWVFGFSNGGYYAASLAARGRLGNDGDTHHVVANGYGVFAGGSGAPYLAVTAKKVTERPRFFVAWGGQDPAHGDQEELAQMLHDLGWPMKSDPALKAGHTATDKQLGDAVAFLSGETEPDKTVPKKTASPMRDKKSADKKKSKSKSKSKPAPKPTSKKKKKKG